MLHPWNYDDDCQDHTRAEMEKELQEQQALNKAQRDEASRRWKLRQEQKASVVRQEQKASASPQQPKHSKNTNERLIPTEPAAQEEVRAAQEKSRAASVEEAENEVLSQQLREEVLAHNLAKAAHCC